MTRSSAPTCSSPARGARLTRRNSTSASKAAKPDRADAFERLVIETLERLAAEPFASERVEAAFQQLAYETLEVKSLFPLYSASCGQRRLAVQRRPADLPERAKATRGLSRALRRRSAKVQSPHSRGLAEQPAPPARGPAARPRSAGARRCRVRGADGRAARPLGRRADRRHRKVRGSPGGGAVRAQLAGGAGQAAAAQDQPICRPDRGASPPRSGRSPA